MLTKKRYRLRNRVIGITALLFLFWLLYPVFFSAPPPTFHMDNTRKVLPFSQQVREQKELWQQTLTQLTDIAQTINDDFKVALVLQAGSFVNKARAQQRHAWLLEKNINAYIRQSKQKDGTVHYRILVGPYIQSKRIERDKLRLEQLLGDEIIILRYGDNYDN